MKKLSYFLTAILIISYINVNAQATPAKMPAPKDTVLETNRKKIDALDKQLIEVLGERERVVREIGIYKAKNNIPSLQAARFQQVLDKAIAAGAKEGLSAEFITEMLNAIHKESLRIEDELKSK